MFKFGFSADKEDADKNEIIPESKIWSNSKEIKPKEDELLTDIMENVPINTITVGIYKIKYLSSSNIVKTLQKLTKNDVSVLKAENNNSDLLPSIYEGGFKIWECTYDLLNYIIENNINLKDKKVLDLGCGAGVIGIMSLLMGATCTFQDYNEDVIQNLTVSNVLINCDNNLSSCKFYSGDWSSFLNLLSPEDNPLENVNKFDYIFTSETIYNTESYLKLHRVFEKLLKNTGIIFLAAKSFYFGVGGGISIFQDFLTEKNIFKYNTCWNCSEGLSREILKIEFNTCN